MFYQHKQGLRPAYELTLEGTVATHGATGNSPRPPASEDCLGGSGLAWAAGDPARYGQFSGAVRREYQHTALY